MEMLSRVEWSSPPLFSLGVDRADIERKFGAAVVRDLDSNGLGNFDAWPVRFECGLEVVIWWFTEAFMPQKLEVHANQRERNHILFHLGFTGATPSLWVPDTTINGPADWQVLRLDDNGNTVEVARVTSACEASALTETLESRGHKQTYWHVRVGSALSSG